MALRAPLPSGTVTLLFTDIEGSTQHWEQQRAAMPAALRRHDELVRAAIEAHGGHVFKTMGDQFCAAFSRPSDAVAAAGDAQRALTGEDWNAVGGLLVRMALHSGSTDERDGDYFGPAVNRVARLLAVAHGGQIVVSGVTAQLLRGLMPEQTELRDLGEHRLKDLVEPERVWQMTAPGLPDSFPALLSLESLPNNLPRQVTPLIGRDDVVAEIEPLVLEHPLLTLVGTGGIGKTRLALQAGANLLDGSHDGVWLVELAPISDASSVVNAIASIFGLRDEGNRPMLELLSQYLRPRRLLLVLDNCEHVVEEVARVAEAILHTARDTRIIATSREPIRIAAEHVYRVPSLTEDGAIALFVERAKASDAKFSLSDENAPIVAEICRRLDGIALAIELAAARVKVMAPRQLAQKLDERFRVLTGGSRTALPRQQTMRALIDWSYDLLSEREQLFFRRLAIFVGGWTLEAAEAVCTDETLDAIDAVDLLSSLVEKSLVVADVEEEDTRYRLLESTRAFALEKLGQSGERDTLARRHVQWAADLADRVFEAKWSPAPVLRRPKYEAEFENTQSAIDWALSHDEIELAARIVIAFQSLFETLAGSAEAMAQMETVLERLDSDAQPQLAARAWRGISAHSVGSRKIEAAQRAVQLGEGCDDAAITVLGLCDLAFGLTQAERPEEAQAAVDRALRLSKESGPRSTFYAEALNIAALVARARGRLDEARPLYAEALAVAAVSDADEAMVIRLNMAELEAELGNHAGALQFAGAVETESRGQRAPRFIIALLNGAAYRVMLGDLVGARTAALEAVGLARGAYPQFAAVGIQHLATVAARNGAVHSGARLRGYVDAWYRGEGCARDSTEQRTYEILMAALREQLTDSEIDALTAEGAQMSEDQAVAEALAM